MSFLITLRGESASSLVKQGGYDWVNGSITDERFPIQKHASLNRKIELFGFDHEPTDDEVLQELRRRNLKRPIYEDALYFGIEYPEEQRKHPIVFLHKPVRVPRGGLDVLVLCERAGRRELDLYWFNLGWPRYCVFAGVRK